MPLPVTPTWRQLPLQRMHRRWRSAPWRGLRAPQPRPVGGQEGLGRGPLPLRAWHPVVLLQTLLLKLLALLPLPLPLLSLLLLLPLRQCQGWTRWRQNWQGLKLSCQGVALL